MRIMFRRKQNKGIQLISITQKGTGYGNPPSPPVVEKREDKILKSSKAKRMARRSLSVEDNLGRFQPLKDKRMSQHSSQPDLLDESPNDRKHKMKIFSTPPRTSPAQSPVQSPRIDAKLKLIPISPSSSSQSLTSQETRAQRKISPSTNNGEASVSSSYTIKIMPTMKPRHRLEDEANKSAQSQLSSTTTATSQHRHSTYVTSGVSVPVGPALKRSKSQELVVVEEEEAVLELRFDDSSQPQARKLPSPQDTKQSSRINNSSPGKKSENTLATTDNQMQAINVQSKYEPVARERTSTTSSVLFDVSYEL